MNTINIIVRGRDFSLIEQSSFEVSFDEANFNTVARINNDKLIKLLIDLLERLETSELQSMIINAEQVESNNDEYVLFNRFNENYYWGGLVGVFEISAIIDDLSEIMDEGSMKEDTKIVFNIQIYSRFDKVESDNKNDSFLKPYFLQTLLFRHINRFNDQEILGKDDSILFNLLLIYAFKERIKEAYKKGIYKSYSWFLGNDSKFKGTIDVNRHIRLNAFLNNGKIAYRYREYSINNSLNKLILEAFLKLKDKYPEIVNGILNNENDLDFKEYIGELLRSVDRDANRNSTINDNLRPIGHPYFHEYENVRILALMILRDEGLDFFESKEFSVKGILSYIPTLWEMFVDDVLELENTSMRSQERLQIYSCLNESNFKTTIIPDFVIYKESTPFAILDAKFKPAWGEIYSEKLGISSVFDDYNKVIRDMNSFSCHYGGVVFPINSEAKLDSDFIEHKVSKYNKTDRFLTIPIAVPFVKDKDYRTWLDCFNQNIIEVKEIINTYINNKLSEDKK